MAYIRHRSRSIQESVYQDLQDTLIACRWMPGVTSHSVVDPDTQVSGVVTRTEADVYPIADGNPIELLDYFPETGELTKLNTFAVDVAQPGEAESLELGSDLLTQPYLFSFALFASSDAVAVAVFNDLTDRYFGRIVRPEYVDLYDFNGLTPTVSVGRLDVDTFRYARDLKTVSPHEVHLYFAELEITDYPDAGQI